MPKGTRMYLVKVYDPVSDVTIASATALEPDIIEAVERRAAELMVPFTKGLSHAAAGQIVAHLWGDEPPAKFEIRSVVEVSRHELNEMMKRSDEIRSRKETT